ncbi:MAG: hypothetical protein KJO25_04025, partial [Bacteroidia bacterium]|nr:hypothetical protein [Bacteroidia bacterium]
MEILIKSSAILFIFYACYRFFLAGETFFRSNRQFLNLGLLCALALPWIVIPVHVVKTAPEITGYFYENSSNSLAEVGAAVTSWTILDVLFSVYLIGLLLFVAKFIMEMLSLGVLILRSRKIRENGFTFVRIKAEVSP